MTDRDRSGAARAADGGSGGGEVPSQTDVIAQLMAQMQQQQLMMESMQEELWQLRQQQQPAQPPVLPPAQPPVQPSTQPTVQPPVHPLVQTQLSVQPRLQQIPKPPTFNPKLNDFAAWSTQLDNFFDLYQVEDDRERRRVLMLALSEDVIKVLTALTMGQPQTKSYDELFSLLKDRHVKKVILPMRRDAFLKARQKGSQSVDEWQTEVCKLAVECEFGTLLESMMLTVFLGGLRDDRLRIHLHAKELATLWEAVDAARLYEAQRCLPPDSKQQEQPQDVNALNQRWQGNQRTSKGKGRSQTGSEPDSRRAEPSRQKTQHKEGDKSFKGKCFNCNEYGHRASACKKPKRKKADINSIHALHDSSLAYLTLRAGENKVRLQVDTGAALTVLKQEDWNVIGRPKLMAPSYKARSYSGHAVRFKGEVDLDVLLCGRRRRLKAFVADDAAQSIMGRDWLEQIDGWEQFKEKLKEQPDLELQLLERDESSEQCYTRRVEATLKKYKGVFQPGLGHCTNRTIHLELKQDARPVWCKARPVPFAKKQRAEEELDRLVANGVITPVKHSDWAAPVVLVDKANGEMRICADYSTGLNAALKIDQYPLPRFEDVFEALNGATVFASLDMKDAYLQCELDDDSKRLTTINTHRGLFKYNRLPFGVASAPAAFQLVMDAMLAGQRRAAAYLDDVVLAGKDEDELLKVIDDVLHRFSEYGLRLRRDKCQFFEKRIKFLGFVIDAAGRHPNPEKISAIKEMPAPRDITQLRAFLGLINFYGSFIPQMSTRTAHLNALLRKDQQWQWTKQAEQEFNSLKKTLTAETLLTHYTPDLPIVVAADASEYGIGGVLLHRMADGSERPIAYVSKALTAAQKNYPQIQKEALALHYAINKFHRYVYGRRFTLQTDHKPLLAIFGNKSGCKVTTAKRLQRYALDLMGYAFDIEYIGTDDFGKADGLSRLPLASEDLDVYDKQEPEKTEQPLQQMIEEVMLPGKLKVKNLALETKKDASLSQVRQYLTAREWPKKPAEGWKSDLRQLFKLRNQLTIEDDVIYFDERPVIPKTLRTEVLDLLHQGHPGIARMKQKGRRYCYWPSFGRDVENYAGRCKPCSLAQKDPTKTTVPWKQCDRPWQRVHIDHAGPFKDGSYLLILVDAYSKWIEASIVRSTSTEATISALAAICARFGWPEQLVADNARGFASSEFCDFLTKKGTERLLIAPQSPWSNGIAERAVGTTKAALEKSKTDGGSLQDRLNVFLEMYRTTPNANDDRSPAERLLRWQPRGPLDALTTATKVVEPTKQESTAAPARTFQAGQRVTVRAWKRGKKFWKAAVVAHRYSAVQYTVIDATGQQELRHVNQMRLRAWPDRCDKYADQDSRRAEEKKKKRSSETTKARTLKRAEKRQHEEEEETIWIYLGKSPTTAPLADLVPTPPPVFQPEDRDQNESGNDHDPTTLQEDESVTDNDESNSTLLPQPLRRSTLIRRQPNPYRPDFYQSDRRSYRTGGGRKLDLDVDVDKDPPI